MSILAAFTMRDEDRVALVGADVLGALQLDGRLLAVEADDDVDVGVLLQLLGHPAAPEGAEAGDEDALCPSAPTRTTRCGGCASMS